MNYSEALSFTFRDKDWVKKMVTGGLLTTLSVLAGLFFILGFFIVGYYINVIKNVKENHETPLPNWSNLSKFFADGILGTVIGFVYLVFIGGLCTLAIIHVATTPNLSDGATAIRIVFISLFTLFLLAFFINYGLIRFALTDNFGNAFKITDVFAFLKGNLSEFISIVVFSFILHGILLCVGLGIFSSFTNFWGLAVQGHLFGQCLRRISSPSTPVETATVTTA